MYEFKLPDLGEGIHEGEILQWHVAAGDAIEEDAPLVDVETDKAAVTIPSPRGGTVLSTTGEPGDVVTTGQVIAVIDDGSGASAGDAAPGRPSPTASEAPADAGPPASTASAERADAERSDPVPAAPATRRLARELGVDLRLVPASGPAGRVTADDVRRFAEGGDGIAEQVAAAEPSVARASTSLAGPAGIPFYDPEPMPDFAQWGPVETEQVRSIRRKIARKMVTSMVVVPHVVHMDEADVTELEALRRTHRDEHPEQPSLTLLSFVVKAVVAGLRQQRAFNASLDPARNEIVYKRYYNIGLAADTPRGLMVPVIQGADRRNLLEVTAEIRRLADAARDGTIDAADLRGGTFTITNIGPLGGVALAPAINYPEVAILGMGQAKPRPVVHDGEIAIRTMLPLTLSFDHRVADGADAARLVSHVVRLLQDPRQLLLEI